MTKHQKVEQLKKRVYEDLNEYHKRIHRVFSTDDGRDLLEVWRDHLMMEPNDSMGKDLFALGLAEGRKAFIRDLILAMKQAEAR